MKSIGSKTPWGRVAAIGVISGERYYWLVKGDDCVAMMPAVVVEESAVTDTPVTEGAS